MQFSKRSAARSFKVDTSQRRSDLPWFGFGTNAGLIRRDFDSGAMFQKCLFIIRLMRYDRNNEQHCVCIYVCVSME